VIQEGNKKSWAGATRQDSSATALYLHGCAVSMGGWNIVTELLQSH